MRRVAAALALALALCLPGCTSRGEQVSLPTDDTVTGNGGCVLLFQVVDVIANPTTGTPMVKSTNAPLVWPKGFSAWRVGSEVEVLDAEGQSVLTTGARYWMCPSRYIYQWVIGQVKPCPDCKLESGVM